jgi:RNA polymerase sigma-70 factor (family 1)
MKKQDEIGKCWEAMINQDDGKAFESLFYLLNARLVKFCMLYVHRLEVAEELVSDLFVICWTKRDQLSHVKNPETYLFISIKNSALNYSKKMSTIELVNIDDHTFELVDTYRPDHDLEKKELMLKLDLAICQLPQQCRIIFRLVKEDGLKCKTVSEILGLSIRTIHAQLFRAMQKLNSSMSSDSHGLSSAIKPNKDKSLSGLAMFTKIIF